MKPKKLKYTAFEVQRSRQRNSRNGGFKPAKTKLHINAKTIDAENPDDSDFGPQRVGHNKGENYTGSYGIMHRYLMSKIGCPWDKVYSEIFKNIDRTSSKGKSLKAILESSIDMHVGVDKDDALRFYRRYGELLYVDPFTGLLSKWKPIDNSLNYCAPYKNEREIDVIHAPDGKIFTKKGNSWVYYIDETYQDTSPIFERVQNEYTGQYKNVQIGHQPITKTRHLEHVLNHNELKEMKERYWDYGSNKKWLERLHFYNGYRPIKQYLLS